MIDPTPDDIGRPVRFTPLCGAPGMIGTLKGFNRTPRPGDSVQAFVAFRTEYPDMGLPFDELSWADCPTSEPTT